jgi:hypothetical protein
VERLGTNRSVSAGGRCAGGHVASAVVVEEDLRPQLEGDRHYGDPAGPA